MTDKCRILELEIETRKLRAENIELQRKLDEAYSKIYHKTFTPAFKENVREHFGRKCVICGQPESMFKRKLSIHHVNEDVSLDCYTSMMVPLCGKCHRQVHIETERHQFWVDFFTSIINNQYGGKSCDVELMRTRSKNKSPVRVTVYIDGHIQDMIQRNPALSRGGRGSEKAIKNMVRLNIERNKDTKDMTRSMKAKVTRMFHNMINEGILIPDEQDGDTKIYYRLKKNLVKPKDRRLGKRIRAL